MLITNAPHNVPTGRQVKAGKPEDILPGLVAPSGQTLVVGHSEVASEELAVEAAVKASLTARGAALKLVWGATMLHADDLGVAPRDIPTVFTNFRNKVEKRVQPRKPVPSERFSAAGPATLPLAKTAAGSAEEWAAVPTLLDLGFAPEEAAQAEAAAADKRGVMRFEGGETAALKRLHHYLWASDAIVRGPHRPPEAASRESHERWRRDGER